MNNPGVFSLSKNGASASDLAIAAAGTTICDEIIDLDGMTAASLQLRFAYGSGGSTCRGYVQTTLDQGSTWIDIACVLFGVVSETALLNLSGLTPKATAATPTDGAMADDTALDGILGDRLRLKVVSTGTYAGSTVLAARAAVR